MSNIRYHKKEVYEKALEALNHGGVFSLTDIESYVGIERHAFRKCIPIGSKEDEVIMDKLEQSKRKAIITIRQKLFKSKSPVAQLSLYKMICTPEEREAISYNKTDVTSNGKEIKKEPVTIEIIDKREQVEVEEKE